MDFELCFCFIGMDFFIGLFSIFGKKFEGKLVCGNFVCGLVLVDFDVMVDVLVDVLICLVV